GIVSKKRPAARHANRRAIPKADGSLIGMLCNEHPANTSADRDGHIAQAGTGFIFSACIVRVIELNFERLENRFLRHLQNKLPGVETCGEQAEANRVCHISKRVLKAMPGGGLHRY